MQRDLSQFSFVDLQLADLGSPKAREFFDVCRREVPFGQLAASVADVFVEDRPSGGAPHWPAETMIKIIFLQKCFGLSDPMAEQMLLDRISFRQFVGLSFQDKTPDHSTISRFRDRLRRHGHGATLFDKTLEILREKGLVVSQGTLIDATIIEAPLGSVREDGSVAADPCAAKTVKAGRVYHGYRAHIATDRNGIITDYVYDSANVSEHTHFDHLARNQRHAVFADAGCRSKQRIERMEARGVRAFFCHGRVKGQKTLSPGQVQLNRLIAPIRAFVEHPFAWIKTRLSNRRTRYRGLQRNGLDFALMSMCCNFCRSFKIKPVSAA